MEEIKLDTSNIENPKNKKNWAIIIAVIGLIILIVTSIMFVMVEDDSASKEKLELTGVYLEVDYTSLLGYSACVKGVATNTTNKDYSYAMIEFVIYDDAGNNLGTAIASITNLYSGDTWSFEATLFSFPDTRPTSYKLVSITAI